MFALAESAENGKYDYRFIFTYYDDAAKRSIVKNLAIILGKEKLVELTGKRKCCICKKWWQERHGKSATALM